MEFNDTIRRRRMVRLMDDATILMHDHATISLIRHGRPSFWQEISPYSVVSGSDIAALSARYQQSGISPFPPPGEQVIHVAARANIVYRSDVTRAYESAQQLGLKHAIVDPLFREVELPTGFSGHVKLPLFLWMVLLRGLWFGGYANHCESIHKARVRATRAAYVLQKAAVQNKHVVVVGHGFMNRFIKKALQQQEWKPYGKGQNSYWGLHQVSR